MFKRIKLIDKPIQIRFENRQIVSQEGDSVAAALLGAGIIMFRQPVDSKTARGPYCMIGNCFECLVEIDGIPNLQACQHRVREGMKVRMQHGLREFGITDVS